MITDLPGMAGHPMLRCWYWWGYFRDGTLGRAPAVQATFSLNVSLLVVVLALLGRSLVAGP